MLSVEVLSKTGSGVLGSEPTGRTPAPGTAFGAIWELERSISSILFNSSAVGKLSGPLVLRYGRTINQYAIPKRSTSMLSISIFFI